jgi:hypothetical protein
MPSRNVAPLGEPKPAAPATTLGRSSDVVLELDLIDPAFIDDSDVDFSVSAPSVPTIRKQGSASPLASHPGTPAAANAQCGKQLLAKPPNQAMPSHPLHQRQQVTANGQQKPANDVAHGRHVPDTRPAAAPPSIQSISQAAGSQRPCPVNASPTIQLPSNNQAARQQPATPQAPPLSRSLPAQSASASTTLATNNQPPGRSPPDDGFARPLPPGRAAATPRANTNSVAQRM